MRGLNIMILFLAIVGFSSPAIAGKIVSLERVNVIVSAEVARLKKSVPLNRQKMKQVRKLFRNWIAPSIDIRKAKIIDNNKLLRTTYMQDIRMESPRLLRERVSPGKLFKPLARPITRLRMPVKTVYREGPAYYKFQKIKETRAARAMKAENAIRLAKNFLSENGFLRETEKDRIGMINIGERRINEYRGEGKKPNDYLVQQDIIFRRVFEGKPVANSVITVGLLPDSKEIVSFEHFNWTPLEEKAQMRGRPQGPARENNISSSEIYRRIKGRLQVSCGNFVKAEIKKAIPAWFQTDSELIPVLVFVADTKYSDGYEGTYTDVTNLIGSDSVLFRRKRSSKVFPKALPRFQARALPSEETPSRRPGFTRNENTDLLGWDYKSFWLDQPDSGKCEEACADDPECKAYTYVKPGIQGPKARCWLKKAVPPPRSNSCCVSGVKVPPSPPKPPTSQEEITREANTDRPGMDYRKFWLDRADPDLCRRACGDDSKCKAYTYVKPGIQGPKARCWLKHAVPPAKSNSCCVSGVKKSAPSRARVRAPASE